MKIFLLLTYSQKMNILIYRHNDKFLESFEKTHIIMMKLYEINIQNRIVLRIHRMKDMERRRNLKRSSVQTNNKKQSF